MFNNKNKLQNGRHNPQAARTIWLFDPGSINIIHTYRTDIEETLLNESPEDTHQRFVAKGLIHLKARLTNSMRGPYCTAGLGPSSKQVRRAAPLFQTAPFMSEALCPGSAVCPR